MSFEITKVALETHSKRSAIGNESRRMCWAVKIWFHSWIAVNFTFWLPTIETHLLQWAKKPNCHEDIEMCHGIKGLLLASQRMGPEKGNPPETSAAALLDPHPPLLSLPLFLSHLSGAQHDGFLFLFLWKSVWFRERLPLPARAASVQEFVSPQARPLNKSTNISEVQFHISSKKD